MQCSLSAIQTNPAPVRDFSPNASPEIQLTPENRRLLSLADAAGIPPARLVARCLEAHLRLQGDPEPSTGAGITSREGVDPKRDAD